jgi:HSP20 family protein
MFDEEVALMALPVLRSRSTGVSTPQPGPTLSRWDPLREFTDLQETFGRLVESVFGSGSTFGFPGEGLTSLPAWRPFADLSETDSAYLVEVEVPGLKRDDVTIELSGSELVIRGQYQESDKTGVMRHRSRRAGQFEYRAALPVDIDAEKVTADLSDGVLRVSVPKTETAKPRRIEITAH